MKSLVLALSLLSSPAMARDYKLIQLEHLDLKSGQFWSNRDPYAPEYTEEWTYRVELNCRFSVLGIVYFDQRPHFEAVNATPKTVGWQWTLGIRLTDNFDLYKDHHSRHIMEDDRPTIGGRNQFPVEDVYGLKITIVDEPGKNRPLSRWFFGD